MILEKTNSCVIKTENGFIVNKCEDKTEAICFPIISSVNGGVNLFGSGVNGGYSYSNLKCIHMKKIKSKIERAKR